MSASSAPLISVVVPCYNHATMVREALRSVWAQDYANLELLVLDDASRDDSVKVIGEVVAEPDFGPRFGGRVQVVVHEGNRGAHRTINQGLSLARGEYVTILNSDDVYAPTRLSRLLAALQAQGSQLAFSNVAFIDARGADVTQSDLFAQRLHRSQVDIAAFPSVGFAALKQNVAISTGNLLFTRGLAERLGGFAPLAYCHDWDFVLRALLLTEPAWVPEPLYRYRFHSDNSFRSLGHLAGLETRQVLEAYLDEVRVGAEQNPLAPSPRNWPGVFEFWLERLHLHRFWRARG